MTYKLVQQSPIGGNVFETSKNSGQRVELAKVTSLNLYSGLTITSLDFSTWNSTGLVTEVFSASQITGITGSLDLDTSAGMDIDAGANIDIDSTSNINLNEGS